MKSHYPRTLGIGLALLGLGLTASRTLAPPCPPPVLTCSPNIVTECGTPVNYTVTAVDCHNSSIPVTCVPPSGTGFPLGASNVVCTATDFLGQSNSCSFTVTIVDTVPPTLEIFVVDNFKETAVACSSGIVVHATSPSGAFVSWGALASDPCGISTLDCSPLIFTFPIGTTTVTCTAIDVSSNTNSCSFDVTVSCAPPTINCSPDIVTECAGASSTPVHYTVTAVDCVGSNAVVVCIPPSGTGFPLGASNVVCTATDTRGATNSCAFTVTVLDTTVPRVFCPPNIVTNATSLSGAAVTYLALASDSCRISNFDCEPPSGTFPIGTTTVTCTASDDTGNTASCSFSVIVRAPDLLISKTVDRTTVKAGQSLTYTIQVRNVGSSAASGVVVSDTLPPQTTFVSASVSQGTFSAPAVGSSGTVTWTAGNLAAGGTATLSLQVKVIGRGKDLIVNTATVTSSTLDSNPNNNTATITTLRKMGP
jgi:uncharacterized repeat protein (TIGR01451 family)